MNWNTIYIKGLGDFREEVKRKLEHSRLNVMPGSLGASTESPYTYDLYWVDEGINCRDFKKAIGARTVWKYRLRFYRSLEEFIASPHPSRKFTLDEQRRINSMREKAKEWEP